MDDVKQEIELNRLKFLVEKYRRERPVVCCAPSPPRCCDYECHHGCTTGHHSLIHADCDHPYGHRLCHSPSCCNRSSWSSIRPTAPLWPEKIEGTPHKSSRVVDENGPTDSIAVCRDLIERRRFQEAFLRLQYYVFHMKIFFAANSIDIIIRLTVKSSLNYALRAAYEYTGGCNPALCVSLDRTLGEALKVDAARRLWGSHSRVNEFDRRYWDIPYYSVSDAALNTTHRARDLERINRESDRIRDELESLRANQEERAKQYARMNPP
ncbi:hypothetical protein X801_00299 [Opisthorchis viverrini]|uniref:Uncharacterized protein n=1 Tax=Opisthorchis viverrini TaxID=6198 RepID=A0A1S8XAQ3_OPIVI|nr:hypothetical protein X801_00299 [Opisthorchis viverrini]